MPTDKEVKTDFEDAYKHSMESMQSYLTQAETCLAMSLNDQWSQKELNYLSLHGREALKYNYMHRIVYLISGYQRRNRLALKYAAPEPNDEAICDIYSQVAMRDMLHSGIYETMSDAFEFGTLRTGLNLVMLYVDYSKDHINGDIRATRVPYNKFVVDPNLFKKDLSDCEYVIHRELMIRDAAIALLPDKERTIKRIQPHRDDKFSRMPYPDTRREDVLRVDMFWRREFEKKKFLLSAEGVETDVTGWDKEVVDERADMTGEEVVSRHIPAVKLYILVEDVVVWKGEEPWGIGDFPYVPVWGLWCPEFVNWQYKLQSLSSLMIDPQREVNRRRSQIIDIIESNINSGWIYEQDAIDDNRQLYQTGQGASIKVNPGALAERRIDRIQAADIPPALMQVEEKFLQSVMDVVGANSELLGMVEGGDNIEISGILAKLRQSQGLTILQPLFDNYRASKTQLGYKLIKMIQANYGPQKIMRIAGVEQLPPNFYDVTLAENDVVATEGILSDSQRQEHWHELLLLKQMGMPIPWTTMVRNAPIHFKQELINDIQEEEKRQQQAMQAQVENQQVMTEMMKAKTASDIAASKMKMASEEENRTDAQLNRVKMAKEVDQMDVNNMLGLADRVLKINELLQQRQEAGGVGNRLTVKR